MKALITGDTKDPTKAVRGTAWAMAAFYVLIVFEFFYMATPFATYFYGAYLPGLEGLNKITALAWLTSFFLPHFATTSSTLVNAAPYAGALLVAIGCLGFLIGAAQVYSRKLRKRGAAVGGLYRIVRHPQYASFILAGAGMLLLWPRFLMIVFFVTMLFAYHGLAWIEERECLRKYGQTYADYRQRTPRFLPFRLPLAGRMSFLSALSTRPWPVRLVAGVTAYAAVLLLAIGIGFAVQLFTHRHLFTYHAANAVYISLRPLDETTLQRIAQTALSDPRVQERLDLVEANGGRLINYVMPWEWGVTEIPMNGLRGHNTPGDHDPRKHKVVFTRALLRGHAEVHGLDILRHTIRTEPVAEAWIDESGQVARVLDPPDEVPYGTVPVPVF
ncbi:MAG: isoprenylcysteine carboxylmethyltransferase family protein [Bacteroidetes bacterium]|nr:isoprenylcysteine carboxylmethyltransferase family protein [Bacteroidota bacterium]